MRRIGLLQKPAAPPEIPTNRPATGHQARNKTMETIKLKNGSEEAKGLVAVTSLRVGNLINTNPMAFFELVRVCRDPSHRPFGNTAQVLSGFSLMEPGGTVPQSIRNIVLSGAQGDGMDMAWDDPVAR